MVNSLNALKFFQVPNLQRIILRTTNKVVIMVNKTTNTSLKMPQQSGNQFIPSQRRVPNFNLMITIPRGYKAYPFPFKPFHTSYRCPMTL